MVDGSLSAHLPIDRLLASASGTELPKRCAGAVLFADLAGFTALTESLAQQLGPRLGAEELTRHLNRVYDVMIERVHRHGGAVVDFSGDAITCWFDDTRPDRAVRGSHRAATCALELQQAVAGVGALILPDDCAVTLSLKVAVAAGPAVRAAVGDPDVRVVDILAGATVARTAAAERMTNPGEVVIDAHAAAELGALSELGEWRTGGDGAPVTVLTGLVSPSPPAPWSQSGTAATAEVVLPWVVHSLRGREDDRDTELRTIVALFVRFAELDFDADVDAATKLDGYVRWVESVVVRHGGTLIQVTIGDKGSYLYVAFGAPVAHEDLADRAVTCALDLRDPPADVAQGEAPAMGLAQGVARTGAYGGVERRTYGVLGDATNIAARLMTLARPGEILSGERVRRDCRQRLAFEDLPAVRVKGHDEPVAIARVVGRAIGAAEGRRFGRLVGRAQELAALVSALTAMQHARRGGTVLVEGDPGAGKSHLIDAARRELDSGSALSWFAVIASDTQSTSLHAFLPLLRDLFYQDLAQDPAAAAQLFELRVSELADVVADLGDSGRASRAQLLADSSYLGALLGLRWEGSPYERHDPKTRFDRSLTAIVTFMRAESLRRPLVVHTRDAHWLDDDSRRVVSLLRRAAVESPVCVLIDRRPTTDLRSDDELTAPDDASPIVRIELGPLHPDGVDELAADLLDNPVDRALVEHLVRRTEGNALFVEQLVLDLRDRELLVFDGAGAWSIGQAVAVGIPETLASVLVSRLDRLEDQLRRIVQSGAVLGERFDIAVLTAMVDTTAESVAELVDAGASAGVWHRLEGGAVAFRHALLRDAAYEMQLDANLRVVHRRAAKAIAAVTARRDRVSRVELAHHEERAGRHRRAAAHLRRAGVEAARGHAYREATTVFRRALDATASLDASPRTLARIHERLADAAHASGDYETCVASIRTALAVDPLIAPARATSLWIRLGEALQRWGRDEEAEMALEAALGCLQESPDLTTASRIYAGLAMVHGRQAEVDAAVELAEMALTFAGSDDALAARAYQCLCVLELQRGRYDDAMQHGTRCRALWETLGDGQGIAAASNNLGMVHEAIGDLGAATADFRVAVEQFEAIGNEHGLACALDNLAQTMVRAGDDEAGMGYLERAVEILSRIGMGSEGVVPAMWRAGSW